MSSHTKKEIYFFSFFSFSVCVGVFCHFKLNFSKTYWPLLNSLSWLQWSFSLPFNSVQQHPLVDSAAWFLPISDWVCLRPLANTAKTVPPGVFSVQRRNLLCQHRSTNVNRSVFFVWEGKLEINQRRPVLVLGAKSEIKCPFLLIHFEKESMNPNSSHGRSKDTVGSHSHTPWKETNPISSLLLGETKCAKTGKIKTCWQTPLDSGLNYRKCAETIHRELSLGEE